MKKLLLAIFLFLTTINLQAQGIEFFKGSWDEALQMAKQQDKLIFIDAFTQWCGPCKRMARQTFPDPEVGKVFNENFINMQMDMEHGPGVEFRKKYPVNAFPTLFFIDGDGKVVRKAKGARRPKDLITLAKQVFKAIDKSEQYEKKYQEGNRSPQLVFKYVKALKKVGKPIGKVVNEYLRSQKDLSTEDNLKFISMATISADSKAFDEFIKHKAGIEKIEGVQNVKDKIKSACEITLSRAIEYNTPDLLTSVKKIMKKHYPEKADAFGYIADMRFYKKNKDAKKYLKAAKNYAKKIAKSNAVELDKVANNLLAAFPKNAKVLKCAEKYAKKAATNGGQAKYFLTYAHILLKSNKKAEAKIAAKKALEIAKKDNKRMVRSIEQFIQQIDKD